MKKALQSHHLFSDGGEKIRPAYVLTANIIVLLLFGAANTKSFSSLLRRKSFKKRKTEQRGTCTALVMQMQSPEVEGLV